MRINKKILFSLMISIILIIIVVQFNIYKRNVSNKKVLLVGKVIALSSSDKESSMVGVNGKVQTSNNEIGILSFIDEENNSFFALGHPFEQNGLTNESLDGEVYEASLKSITRSSQDSVGKLNAKTNTTRLIGSLDIESYKGIYGQIDTEYLKNNKNNFYEVEVASKYDVKKGKCSIFINLDGNTPLFYEAEIENIDYFSQTQNLEIKITDENLIKLTGGSVRGMSGSPIIQDGKIVGVLNYADVQNPCNVLAIFAEDIIN